MAQRNTKKTANAKMFVQESYMKMGGITKAMQIANEARSKNIGVMLGCMEETTGSTA